MALPSWFHDGKEVTKWPQGYAGMVYLIENTTTGMFYVGKKLFSKAGPKKKGQRRKVARVESNWKEYVGSNTLLQEHIARGDEIRRTILRLCKTRGETSYYEAYWQFQKEVLLREDCYNGQISVRIAKNTLHHLKKDVKIVP